MYLASILLLATAFAEKDPYDGRFAPALVAKYCSEGRLKPEPSMAPYIFYVLALSGVVAVRNRYYTAQDRQATPHLLNKADVIEDSHQSAGEPQRVWGGVSLADSQLGRHFAIMGQTGSGKTTALRMLMGSALNGRIAESPPRALVFDPKREALPILRGIGIPATRIHILNPFDARGEAWDLAKDVRTEAQAVQLGVMLVPNEQYSASPYFHQAAQELVIELIKSLQSLGKPWALNDILEAASTRERLIETLSITQEGQQVVDRHLTPKAEQTTASVLSTLSAKLRLFHPVARIWARCERSISLTDWLRETDILVLGSDEAHADVLRPINEMIFQRAAQLIDRLPERKEGEPQTWVFLDEARAIGKLDGLNQLLIKGRSRGVRVVLGFQDLDGLSSVYGEAAVHEMLGECSNMGVLRIESTRACEWASKRFGEYYQTFANKSTQYGSGAATYSYGESTQLAPMVLPSYFKNLPSASAQTGFVGVFSAQHIRPWVAHITPNDSRRFLHPLSEEGNDVGFIERDAADQKRVPWPTIGLPPHLGGDDQTGLIAPQ